MVRKKSPWGQVFHATKMLFRANKSYKESFLKSFFKEKLIIKKDFQIQISRKSLNSRNSKNVGMCTPLSLPPFAFLLLFTVKKTRSRGASYGRAMGTVMIDRALWLFTGIKTNGEEYRCSLLQPTTKQHALSSGLNLWFKDELWSPLPSDVSP